jgi:hypothetical protein
MNSLPGIVSIRYIECENIQPHVMQQSMSGAIIDLALPTQKINFYGIPKLEWSGSLSSGCRIEKTTLEFKTTEIIPEGRRLAFIVTGASGRQFLIGSREPKYPQIEYTESAGSPSGDAALRTYKITHVALKSVLPCVL